MKDRYVSAEPQRDQLAERQRSEKQVKEMQRHIDFDSIHRILVLGIRRVAVFMGLGINAVKNPDFSDYQLTNLTFLQFIEPDASAERIADFKRNFSQWTITNGFRDITETFAVYLDRLYSACLLVAIVKLGNDVQDAQKKERKFRNEGLSSKRSLLADHFKITVMFSELLDSIAQTRNCLAHRRGIVGAQDCRNSPELVVAWRGIRQFISTPDEEVDLPYPMPPGGIYLPKGGELKLQVVTREKRFPKGSVVELNPVDLSEICWFALSLGGSYTKEAIDFARKSGIEFREPLNEDEQTR